MSLTLGDNFSYQASKPLDARLKYDTVAAMKAVGDSTMYNGCLAYCVATDKTYQWKSTNTVDTDLGKWREFSSGGGGGHAIEDSEGTALTQRETMQFGDGLNATDDSENEKTVVEPNLMTAADMDDVVTPLPSVQSRYHKYSTEEQIVGEWIDGKPIYQKTFTGTWALTVNQGTIIATISNIEKLIDFKGTGYETSSGTENRRLINSYCGFAYTASNGQIGIQSTYPITWDSVTIQYTKTTS